MIPTLRIMTRKSKLGSSRWADYTIQRLLDLKKFRLLIAAYYEYTSINYVEDILIELKITEEYRIKKPSSSHAEHLRFLKDHGMYEWWNSKYSQKNPMKPKSYLRSNKMNLRSKNHGH